MQNSFSVKSNSFCIMPWVHLHVAQNGNVIPCCQAPPHKVHRFGSINEQSIKDIWKSEPIKDFRNKMLSDEKDIRCKQCYIKEEQGWQSLRQVTNQKFKAEVQQIKTGALELSQPVYFDLRFSNACNLKCRICGPWASSQWYKDAVATGMRTKDDKALTLAVKDENQFFKELTPLLSSAKEFYFAGGEPLMMKQHYKVLDALINAGNTSIQLSYNTNFSTFVYRDYNVLNYWKKFPNVSISASLDAEGKRGELLRKNLNWDKVIQNRKMLLKEVPYINFQIAPTVCIFNVSHLPDFHKNWVEQKLIKVEDFTPTLLIHPKEYQINGLPKEIQLKLKEKYQAHIDWMKHQMVEQKEKFDSTLAQFKSIAQQLGVNAKNELTVELMDKTQQLDKLRNENTIEIFPELKSALCVE